MIFSHQHPGWIGGLEVKRLDITVFWETLIPPNLPTLSKHILFFSFFFSSSLSSFSFYFLKSSPASWETVVLNITTPILLQTRNGQSVCSSIYLGRSPILAVFKNPQSNTGPPHLQFNSTQGSRTSPFSEREAPRSLGSSWGIHNTTNAIGSFQSFVSTTSNWTFAPRSGLQVRILYSGLKILAPGTTHH